MTIKDTFLKVFKRKAKADVDYPVNDVVNHNKHVAHDFDGNEVKVPVTEPTIVNTKKAYTALGDAKLRNKQVENILETSTSRQVIKEMANHLYNYLPNPNMDICTDIAKKVASLYTREIFGANRCDVLTEDLAGIIWGEATGRPSMHFHKEGSMQYHLYMSVTETIRDMWLKYFSGETARKTELLIDQHLLAIGKMPSDPEEAKHITAAYALYFDLIKKTLDKDFLSMEVKTKERICQAVEYVCKSFFTSPNKGVEDGVELDIIARAFEGIYWERNYPETGLDSDDHKLRAYHKVRALYKHLHEVYGDTAPYWVTVLYDITKEDLGEFKAKLAKYLFDNYPKGYYHGGEERFAIAAEVIVGYKTRYNRNASVEDIKPLADTVYVAITGGYSTSFSDLDPIQRDIFFASVINAADMWTTYSNSPITLEEVPTDVSKEMISMAGKIGTHKTLHPNIEVVGSYGFLIQGTIEDVEEAKEIVSVARDVYTIITDRRELDNCSAEVRQRYINAIVGIKRNIQVLNITSKYHLWIYLRNDLQLAQVYNAVQDASVDKCLDVFYVKHNQKPQPSDVVDKVKQMEVDLIDNYNTVKKIHGKVQEDELIELLLPAVEDHFSRFISSTRKLRQNNKHKAIAKAFIDNAAHSHKFDVCLKMRQAFLKGENVRDDVKHINELRKEYRDTLLSAYDILVTIKNNYYDSKKAPMIPQDPMKKTDHPNIFVSDTDIGISGSETDNKDAKHIVETAKKVYAALHQVDESLFVTMRDTIRVEYINAMVNIKKHLSNPTNITNYSSDPHYRSLCYTLSLILKLNTSLSWAVQAEVGTILMKAFAEGHMEKISVINTLASTIYIGCTGARNESLKDAGANATLKFTEAAKCVATHYFNNADHDNINGETLKLVDPVAAILWDTTNNAIPISLDTILIAKGIQNGLDYLHGRYYKTVPAWAAVTKTEVKKDSSMDKNEFINHLSRNIYVVMVGPNNARLYDRLGDAPLNNWVDNLINTVYTHPDCYHLGINAIASLVDSLKQVWLNGNNVVSLEITERSQKAVGDSIQYLSDTFGNQPPKWWVKSTEKKEETIKEVLQEAIKKEEPVQQLHHVPDELVYTLRNALHEEFKHIDRYNWRHLTEAAKNDINAAVTAFLVNYRTPDASPNGRAHKLGVATKMQSVITTFDTPALNHEEVKNVTHITLHNLVDKMCDIVEKWKRDFPGTFVHKEPTPVKDDSEKHIEECGELIWENITFHRDNFKYSDMPIAIQKLYDNAASLAINFIKSRGDDFNSDHHVDVANLILTELCFDKKYLNFAELNDTGKAKYLAAVARIHTYLTDLNKPKTTAVFLSTSHESAQKMARILHSVDHDAHARTKTWEELPNGIQARYSMQALQVIDKMRDEFAANDFISHELAVKMLADVYRAEGTYCDYRTWSELPEDVKKQLEEKAVKRLCQVAQK